jgi:UDP-N-acetylmuramate dehydrogenase
VISERHANVIVNQTDARAQDVLELMIAAHRAVKQRFGIDLEPELVLAGELAERWRRETSS